MALLSRAEPQRPRCYLHIVTDLAAFIGTGIAAVLILLTGWNRLDPIASLLVAALMFAAAWSLLRESGRIFLEGAPASAAPADVGPAIVSHPESSRPTTPRLDGHRRLPALRARTRPARRRCHRIRLELEALLHERLESDHTTLQVEHVGTDRGLEITRSGSRGDLQPDRVLGLFAVIQVLLSAPHRLVLMHPAETPASWERRPPRKEASTSSSGT